MRKSKRRVQKTMPHQAPVARKLLPQVSAGAPVVSRAGEHLLPRDVEESSPSLCRPLEFREHSLKVPTESNSTYVDLECLADITFEPLEPVWGSVVARGAVTVLAGEPGVGKSFVALNIAAAVTRGELGPVTTVAGAGPVWGQNLQGHPFPTRERPNDSEPKSIANPADPRPSHPTSREPYRYSEPDAIAHPADPRPGQGVLICSPHYERSTTLMKRLTAANANLSLIQTIHGVRQTADFGQRGPCWSFQLDRDLTIFEQELMLLQGDENDIGLVVIDPFPLGMSGSGAKQARQLQELTSRLAEIAHLCQVAVLLVCEALPLEDCKRVTSITPYPTVERVAQSVWVIERDPKSPGHRMLLPVKLAEEELSPGLRFCWRDGAIDWEPEPLHLTAQEFRTQSLQRARNPLMLEDASELSRAMDWLNARLADGPVQSNLIRREADDNEISYATLRRAFCALRIESNQIKGTRRHTWALAQVWQKVEISEEKVEAASPPRVVDARRVTGAECDDRSRDGRLGEEDSETSKTPTPWHTEEVAWGDFGGAEGLVTASCVGDTQGTQVVT